MGTVELKYDSHNDVMAAFSRMQLPSSSTVPFITVGAKGSSMITINQQEEIVATKAIGEAVNFIPLQELRITTTISEKVFPYNNNVDITFYNNANRDSRNVVLPLYSLEPLFELLAEFLEEIEKIKIQQRKTGGTP